MTHPARVLVVDDEPNMRKSLADILQDEGYEVATAGDGCAAVELCAQTPFDVVLMDVRMPGLDGVEAFRQIRQHCAGTRVILMSAYGVDDLRAVALDEGAIAFLEKPLDLDKLIRLINRATDHAVLLVEVDPGTSGEVSHRLHKHGYHVTVAANPQEALAIVEQIRFGIILIDVDLPAMNGRDLYLAIRQLTPAAVAVMIAGAGEQDEQLARDAVRQTAYTFVRKPLDLDHLLALLERIRAQRASDAVRKPPETDS